MTFSRIHLEWLALNYVFLLSLNRLCAANVNLLPVPDTVATTHSRGSVSGTGSERSTFDFHLTDLICVRTGACVRLSMRT